ncbi:hypothetical protein EVAR_103657_1 [Eumeta japonica]|uniref:Uncharacterized protein n=1 Tax=Eumeta variegata TaxID=151549 RepID=A0A4C1Z5L4_EUMVA|nr:hypothetical protein EVAR_103657_1 [Eumeta japonica]
MGEARVVRSRSQRTAAAGRAARDRRVRRADGTMRCQHTRFARSAMVLQYSLQNIEVCRLKLRHDMKSVVRIKVCAGAPSGSVIRFPQFRVLPCGAWSCSHDLSQVQLEAAFLAITLLTAHRAAIVTRRSTCSHTLSGPVAAGRLRARAWPPAVVRARSPAHLEAGGDPQRRLRLSPPTRISVLTVIRALISRVLFRALFTFS